MPGRILAESYASLSMLIKDNKYEIIQINIIEPENKIKDAVTWYIKRAATVYETICGVQHPFVAELYNKLSLRYQELKKNKKSLIWSRKSFCIFYFTLGANDDITKKSYNHLNRLESIMGTEYRDLHIEQLYFLLIGRFDNFEEVEDDDDESDEEIEGNRPYAIEN